MDQPPTIMALKFIAARQVLAREDAGFTRWLSEHLEYLEPVLGLSSPGQNPSDEMSAALCAHGRSGGGGRGDQLPALRDVIEERYGHAVAAATAE